MTYTGNHKRPAIFYLLLFTLSSLFAQRADYLIVENPAALIILDKYEQNSRLKILPFTPFRILEEHTLLSDDLTPALKAQTEEGPLFILRNEDGKIAGEDAAGYIHIFRKCTQLGDTIRVLRNKSILFYKKYFTVSANQRRYLQQGDILIRLFKYRQGYYLKRINRSPAYGWCRLPAGQSWLKLEGKTAGKPVLSEALRLRIKAFISRINRLYENYFAYFNRTYRDEYPPPGWQVSETEEGMKLVLTGIEADALIRSNEVLIRNLETLLLGSGFFIRQTDGTLQILPRLRGQQ